MSIIHDATPIEHPDTKSRWPAILDFFFTFLITFLTLFLVTTLWFNGKAFAENEKTPEMKYYRLVESYNHANSKTPITEEDIPGLKEIAEKSGCPHITIAIDDGQEVTPGNAAVSRNNITVSKYMPKNQTASMIIHECAHVHQFNLMTDQQVNALDYYYPPTEVEVPNLPVAGDVKNIKDQHPPVHQKVVVPGYEQNADCIAKELGASVFYYTQDCSGVRGEVARAILQGINPFGDSTREVQSEGYREETTDNQEVPEQDNGEQMEEPLQP